MKLLCLTYAVLELKQRLDIQQVKATKISQERDQVKVDVQFMYRLKVSFNPLISWPRPPATLSGGMQ